MRSFALASLAFLLAGCASGPSATTGEADVQPGKFKEINFSLDEGKSVSWEWSATGGRARFDVHSHKDGVVTEHVLRTATSDQGSFTAPWSGEFSLLWEDNAPGPLHVTYDVWMQGHIDSEYP
jgi:hypothetical protein